MHAKLLVRVFRRCPRLLQVGLGPALMSSAISALIVDYMFMPPYLGFATTDTWYLITAITLMCAALVVSFLTNAETPAGDGSQPPRSPRGRGCNR